MKCCGNDDKAVGYGSYKQDFIALGNYEEVAMLHLKNENHKNNLLCCYKNCGENAHEAYQNS